MDKTFAFAQFCDDVRYEVGGKVSLVGIYGSDLIISDPLPVALPKLCVALVVSTPIDALPEKVIIKLSGPPVGPDGATVTLSEEPIEAPPDNQRTIANLSVALPLSPFLVRAEGAIEVSVDIGREVLLAGRLHVIHVPQEEQIAS